MAFTIEYGKVHNYIETEDDRERGHVDTRSRNHPCENKDEHLGCNLGVDVPG